ncbi:MAG: 4Fe-4S binding protein [Acidilobaceae archaeon]|nr:4Fe-4S binding protein [Acidilobaceae archaeon]MCX8165725.1 4Fe-4S binding protein [Acidilobaceae archaeon]MDW7974150.1 4Fe-4S binding protein [Sulfolobales archaeon]
MQAFKAQRLVVLDANKCVGCQLCMLGCSSRLGYAGPAKSHLLIRSAGGIERGFVVVVCRACEDPPCSRVCPTGALTNLPKGGVRLQSSKCIGCKNCVEACDIGAVLWDEELEKPLICIQCGYCVDFCPYGVLGVEAL